MHLLISNPMAMEENFDDDLEAIFIEETFHTSEPIREKPIQNVVERVWIKKTKVKDISTDVNGIKIKSEFKAVRPTVNEKFAELQALRLAAGVVFDTDNIDDDDEDDDDDSEEYEDVNESGTMNEELGLTSGKHQSRATKRKLIINLAKKLKKKSIANRLGVSYKVGKGKMKEKASVKSWSEKFGRLLAAKKLLYLPLLYRKYKMGPKRTREELDIEIDLYMSEVKKRKLQLAFNDITNSSNNVDNEDREENCGYTIVNAKELFGGFGGPGWRKKVPKPDSSEPKVDKRALDMEIDEYMSKKDNPMDDSQTNKPEKDELDMELDTYMASVKKNVTKEVLANGY